jgi:hypothetical protein
LGVISQNSEGRDLEISWGLIRQNPREHLLNQWGSNYIPMLHSKKGKDLEIFLLLAKHQTKEKTRLYL